MRTGRIAKIGSVWAAMKDRCSNKNTESYRLYGGRGITVCQFLKASPWHLLSIVGEPPDGLSIDRIDNDGHYSCGRCFECVSKGWPMNLRWADRFQQARNRRDNHLVSANGKTKCVVEWAEESGLNKHTVYSRMKKGWDHNRVVEPMKKSKLYTAQGKSMTIVQWSDHLGIKLKTLQRRLAKGMDGERLFQPLNTQYQRENYRLVK